MMEYPDPMEITLLSIPDCKLCDHAKAALSRISEDYAIAVDEMSANTEQGMRMMTEHRVAFMPGVFIDGRLFSYGRLSERRLRRELERASCPHR